MEEQKMISIVKKIIFSMALVLFTAGLAIAADSIVIKGSTTVLPITQAALEAYVKVNKGVQVSLSGGGSGEGIKALIDKSTDIANSSREIKKEEIKLAATKGVKPVAHVVAYDALTPIRNP